MAEGDALARMKHRADQEAVFRTMEWAVKLPRIRTAKGHVDHILHRVAVVLALHADGRTGENAFPSQKTIAEFCGADSLSAVADALARGEELGLWDAEEDASPWGTVQWRLAVEDDGVIERLEKAEEERLAHKRSLKAAKNRRAYGNRAGIQPQSTGSESFSPSGPGLQPQWTKSSVPVDHVLRPSGQGLQPQPGLDNQPSSPALVDQPSSTGPLDATPPPDGGDRVRTQSESKVARKRAFVRGLPAAYQAGFVTDEDLLAIVTADTTALTEEQTVALGANSDCPSDTDEHQWAWLAARPSHTSPTPEG